LSTGPNDISLATICAESGATRAPLGIGWLKGLVALYGRQHLLGHRPPIKRFGLQRALPAPDAFGLLAVSADAAARPGEDAVATRGTNTTNITARNPRQTTASLAWITGRIVPPSNDGDRVTDDD
jgi:hypothetical protein